MIFRREQNCQFCKHYLSDKTCLAFPDSIPDDLWSGANLHLEPYPGDQGYRHERKFTEFPPLTDEQVEAFQQENGGT